MVSAATLRQPLKPGPAPRLWFLVLAAPLAWAAHAADLPTLAFPLAAVALVGAAFVLGEAAEVLASRVGEGVGSLLTATFSNIVTLTVLGAALLKGLYDLVLAGLIGALLGNILLALGGAMLAGGWGRDRQSFGRAAAASNATLLIAATFALVLPTLVGRIVDGDRPGAALDLTLPVCLILLATYVLGLYFSVKTHRHLFDAATVAYTRAHPFLIEHPLPVLAASVAAVGAMAQVAASSIEPVGERLGLSPAFMGIIVVGAIANSVEVSAAWKFARRDRMNLTLQIATGSGIQVVLFVTPLLVLLSQVLPGGPLALDFPLVMVVVAVMAVLLVNIVSADGESTWYEGVLLLALHLVVAVVFYIL